MSPTRAGILMLSSGAMALIWRFALANYISLAAMERPYPLPEALLALGLAAVVTAFTHQRGWRIIAVAGIQVCVATLVVLRTVFVYRGGSSPFLSHVWLSELIDNTPEAVEWLRLILVAGLAVGFWFGGWFLSRTRERLQSHYSRFDIGLAFFFILFVSKLVVWHKTGIEIPDPLASPLAIAFMAFALLTVGLTRRPASVHAHFISGRQTLGMLLSIILMVVLLSIGALLLFLPYMTLLAEAGLAVLKQVGTPIGAVLLAIVKFMFTPRHIRPTPSAPPAGPSVTLTDGAPASGGWMDLALTIVSYSVAGLTALLGLAAAVLLVGLLVRRLWARTPGTSKRKPDLAPAALWTIVGTALRRFPALLKKIMGGLLREPPTDGAQLFAALSTWGRRSGIPRRHYETPLEYGRRLRQRFPRVTTEIEVLVELFNQEVYGAIVIDRTRLIIARTAWRSLRSPRHWRWRLASRLTGD